MEVLPAGPGGPSIEPILHDYRQRSALSESTVLQALVAALATRRAQALVAVECGRPVGAVVLSRQGAHGQIHLLHALPDAPQACAALLEGAEVELGLEPGLESICAMLVRLPGIDFRDAFLQRGYATVPRARMLLALADLSEEVVLPPEYQLVPWQESYLDRVAGLAYAAHQGEEDRVVYPDWATEDGARQLLEQAIGGSFGRFDPALSPMVVAGESLAGFCLSLWHGGLAGQGFVADLCVDATCRGRGLGRALLVASAGAFGEAGAVALGLAVNLSNGPALHLYGSLGFRVEHYFDLFRRGTRQTRQV